jgi:hypothetical protein
VQRIRRTGRGLEEQVEYAGERKNRQMKERRPRMGKKQAKEGKNRQRKRRKSREQEN